MIMNKLQTKDHVINYWKHEFLWSSITRKMLDQRGTSLIKQLTTGFIYCHGMQTMHVVMALPTGFVSQAPAMNTLGSLLRPFLAKNTILSVLPEGSFHIHMKTAIAHAKN